MKTLSLKVWLRYLPGLSLFFNVGFGFAQQARAGALHSGSEVERLHNGWSYALDSFNDGFDGDSVGDRSAVEFYGMAMKEEGDRLYFAFNSNLAEDGLPERRAWDSRISYGDFFLNFSDPSSFDGANGQLYGIHFNDNDNSFRNMEWGLYETVYAGELVLNNANAGVTNQDGSLQHTQTLIEARGGNVSYGDLASNTSYFNLTQAAPTMIVSGTKIGEIDSLDVNALTALQLDFGHFSATGTHTFGFSIERELLPSTEFMAHLFIDSGNEGIALRGHLSDLPSWVDPEKKIPEPNSILGLSLIGALMLGWHRMAQASG